MKKKITILLLTLCLTIAPMTALAAGARVESLEYEGFGVLKLDFPATATGMKAPRSN